MLQRGRPGGNPQIKLLPGRIFGMNAEIAKTAGDVWHALNESEGLTRAEILQTLGIPDDLFNRAIGWLAREDQLSFDSEGDEIRISLKHR